MDDSPERAKLIDQAKQANNILVAVSSNPSVDELAAAMALTLMLNKNDRRAVAVFSGEIPDVLSFLKPEKTFDKNADGLRDFIISLDPKKADYLRYKVVDDMVRIFITPNNTVITSKDLEFSQGDYNVDMVVAVGVRNQEELDQALRSHGRILHDAAVFAISIGDQTSSLGTTNWHDPKAVSYAQLIASLPSLLDLGEEANQDYEPAMDKSVANALLTSLVAVTNRFSNNKTTADVMTLAAELMKAGANQQLIANELASGNQKKKTGLRTDKQDPKAQVSLRLDKKDEPKQDKPSMEDSKSESTGTRTDAKPKAEPVTASKPEPAAEAKAEPEPKARGGLNLKDYQKKTETKPASKSDDKISTDRVKDDPAPAAELSPKLIPAKEISPYKLTENEKALAQMAAEGTKNFTDLDEYSREYIETKRKQTADDLVAKLKKQELNVSPLAQAPSTEPEPAAPVAELPPLPVAEAPVAEVPAAQPMTPSQFAATPVTAEPLPPIAPPIAPTSAPDEANDMTIQQAAQALDAQADQLSDRLQKQLEASEQKYAAPAPAEVPSLSPQLAAPVAGQPAAVVPEPAASPATTPVAAPATPAAMPAPVMPPMPPAFDPNNPMMPPMPPAPADFSPANLPPTPAVVDPAPAPVTAPATPANPTQATSPNPFDQFATDMAQAEPTPAPQVGQTVQPQIVKSSAQRLNPTEMPLGAGPDMQLSSNTIVTPSVYPQPSSDNSQFVIPE